MAYQSWHPPPPPPPQGGAGAYYNQQPTPSYTPPPAVAHDPFRSYYADRLRQLTFNSRPLIQELSVMAMQQRDGNNWDAMKAVVEEIENAVLRVRGIAH
jgi:pre-mRNA cleavage complex 2 protein Pcf11